MTVNRYQRHVFVLPEHDANRQLANGFLRDPFLLDQRIRVLSEAGGWRKVLERFKSVHVREMEKYPDRFMILLIDSDDDVERVENAKAEIPGHLSERVFILGALSNPEALRQANLGSFEEIGLALAKDCRDETDDIWGHKLLRHNATEVQRLRQHVRPILFPPN